MLFTISDGDTDGGGGGGGDSKYSNIHTYIHTLGCYPSNEVARKRHTHGFPSH